MSRDGFTVFGAHDDILSVFERETGSVQFARDIGPIMGKALVRADCVTCDFELAGRQRFA